MRGCRHHDILYNFATPHPIKQGVRPLRKFFAQNGLGAAAMVVFGGHLVQGGKDPIHRHVVPPPTRRDEDGVPTHTFIRDLRPWRCQEHHLVDPAVDLLVGSNQPAQ